MKKEIIIILTVATILVTHLIIAPFAFSDDFTAEEQLADNFIKVSDSSSMGDVLIDSTFSNSSVLESSDNKNEEVLENYLSETIEQETEKISKASDEELEKTESVFYNNQWFEFPIQKEIEEISRNLKDNHKLGTYTKPEGDEGSVVDQITEDQMGRPRWDFIDVSSHQGELSVEDYRNMKKHGVTGVVVKLTEGTFYKNPFADNQIKNAKKAGLKVSTYHFSRYTTKSGAESEAIYYANEAKRLNLTSDTIMVNDLEQDFNRYSTQNAIFFSNKLKELGYDKTMYYSSSSTFSEGKLSASILGESSLWVAQYPYEPTNETILHNTRSAWQWSDNMVFTQIIGKVFDVSMDHDGLFSNPHVDGSEIDKVPIVSEKSTNKYGTITSKGEVIWEDMSFKKEIGISDDYFQRTFFIEKELLLLDGSKFLLIRDNKNKLLGYIDEGALTYGESHGGAFISESKYVSMTADDYDVWENLTFTETVGNSNWYNNMVFKVKGKYNHFNGSVYYSLYSNEDKWLGYINEEGVSVTEEQGSYKWYGKYVTMQGNYNIWDSFDWTNPVHSSKYKNQTLYAKGIYHHFNGSRYLSVYDTQDEWIGYINEEDTYLEAGPQGPYKWYGKYVTMQGNYNIWDSFDWTNPVHSSKYKNQTLYAKGIYHHFNGSRYLSVYDTQDEWIGYINEEDTYLEAGPQGPYHFYDKYVTMKGLYDIWDGFSWKNKVHSSRYKGQTMKARGIYYHFNGSTYLSLYDSQNNWLGYINEKGTNLASGAQGVYQSYNKHVTVKSDVYTIWRDFSWEKKAMGEFVGKTYLAKGVYNHFNGSSYLSLYDSNDNWIGYINEKGTKLGQSQADKFKKVQDLLNKEYNNKNFGIYVTSLVDGSVAQINGSQQFHAASTGKLPALYYTQKMILDKKVDGNHPYIYTDAINQMPNAYMRGGAGVLQGQPYGKKFSLNTIMNWTAKYSDNQGTNFLAYYAANKYDVTMKKEISRIMERTWSSPFYVTAKDNAKMLEAIYHQGGKLITDLSNTVYDDQRIPKYLPVQVAHKIGDVEDLRHDAGIVYSKNPYTLSILTKNYQSYEQISILSKKIYDILK